jgi:raffinose/stachyose/melibiose transport system substrate-binding protein
MNVQLRNVFAVVVSLAVVMSACGSGDDDAAAGGGGGGGSGGGEEVTLTLLVGNDPATVALAEGLTAAYTDLHPEVTFDIEERPGGAEGDNVVKTRLATGEMNDVFFYNAGSLLQALNPAQSVLDLTEDPMLDDVAEEFVSTVTQEDRVYGVPVGTSFGGGILYNRQIYEDQGLEIPRSWDEFADNNDRLLDAGITPLGASFGTTWTSQLLVLADFYNVAQAEPSFAEDYTANEAKYATTPAALTSFERLEEGYDSGWWNDDYGSATYENALQMMIDGEIAQYPMLTVALPALAELDAEAAGNIGIFAQPGPDAATNGMTLWMPLAAYVAADTEHPDEAREFLAFIASTEGTDAMNAATEPTGPYLIDGAELPDDVLPAVLDVQAYLDDGNVGPALEFVSPVKGPNLEHLTVEVGSGLRSPAEAAELYDEDVAAQAQQLGLPGW